MKEIIIEISDHLFTNLKDEFKRGHMFQDEDGHVLYVEKHLVELYKNMKIEIFSDEHGLPHFRVKVQNSTANFRISDCECIAGSGEVMRYKNNIRKWWKDKKQILIDVWNKTRPSDCPVGKYRGL